jgi:fused signal recognition particle receptor
VSQEPEKKRGLLGRLFGGKATPAPSDAETIAEVPETGAISAGGAASELAPAFPPAPSTGDVAKAAPSTQMHEEAPIQDASKNGWFQRLKAGLVKTSSKLTDGITSVFTKRKLDGETLEELEDLLLQADLGLETTHRVTANLRKNRFDKTIAPEEVRQVLAEEVERVLRPVAKPLVVNGNHKPEVILFVGVNGTGKTTTIGKLASRFRGEGKTVMLAAGDTFRAAAIEQLKVWGERTGAPVIAGQVGADAAGLAFDAMTEAQRVGIDVLLVDTAGRLQNKKGLMEELEKVVRVIRKVDPSAPHQVLLVLDATTGQNAVTQVEVFQKVAGVTGLVMTKLDGTARGGILVAISAKFGLPVVAIGIGEKVEDLQPFEPVEFARAIAEI